MENKKKLISSHIFILPFKIRGVDKKNREKEILKNFEDWENSLNDDKEIQNYLNKYAKDALFSYGNDENDKYVKEKNYKNLKNGIYRIEYKGKEYNLEIENIKIKFFDTNIGTLSFILNNNQYEELEDILLINNQGRKIYKAYSAEDCSNVTIFNSEGLERAKQNIGYAEIVYEKKEEKLKNDIISYFLNLDKIEPILDDRMFVMSHYLYSSNEKNILNDMINNWENSENWYKYVFMDLMNSLTCHDEEMMRELLRTSTYRRWRKSNTLFGISGYSLVLLTDDGGFPKNVLNDHMKKHYFQIVSMVIAQKATIISLNETINNLLLSEETGKKKEYEEYLLYLSKMHFKEITQQEQGMELYNMCQEKMKIKEVTEEMNQKIKTLNEKYERENDKREEKREKEIERKIKWTAILFSVSNFILSIIAPNKTSLQRNIEIVLLIVFVCIYYTIFNWENKNRG